MAHTERPGHQSAIDDDDGPDDASAQANETISTSESDEVTCSNCGHVFAGNYCPECGQKATPAASIPGVMSGFFRGVADIEQGLWSTLVGLTIRPGQTLSQYLGGVRGGLVQPGRYLFLACVAYFGIHWGLERIGVRAPLTDALGLEGGTGLDLVLADSIGVLVRQQEYHFAHGLVAVGLLALLLWRLFREELDDGASALVLGSYLVGHALVLATLLRLLYLPVAWLVTGRPASTPFVLGFTVYALYPVVAIASCFGMTLKNVLKSGFAAVWSFVDLVSLLGAGSLAYGIWLANSYPDTYIPSEMPSGEFTLILGITGAILALPVVLHLLVEGYLRLRG